MIHDPCNYRYSTETSTGSEQARKKRHEERKPPAKKEEDGDAEWDEEPQEDQKGDSGSRRGMKMVEEGKAGRQAGREEGAAGGRQTAPAQ